MKNPAYALGYIEGCVEAAIGDIPHKLAQALQLLHDTLQGAAFCGAEDKPHVIADNKNSIRLMDKAEPSAAQRSDSRFSEDIICGNDPLEKKRPEKKKRKSPPPCTPEQLEQKRNNLALARAAKAYRPAPADAAAGEAMTPAAQAEGQPQQMQPQTEWKSTSVEQRIDRVKELCDQGKKDGEIGQIMGTTAHAVTCFRFNHGIKKYKLADAEYAEQKKQLSAPAEPAVTPPDAPIHIQATSHTDDEFYDARKDKPAGE